MKRLAAVLLVICFAVAGCMRLGPDYRRPETGIETPGTYRSAEEAGTRQYISNSRWWKEFDDPRLNTVVANAMRNHPDIHKAAASVMEARAMVRQTRADQFPSLELNADASRQQQSVVDFMAGGDYTTVNIDSFSTTLPASFELDLWGRLSRATEAARADLLAAEENRRTIVQSLVAETVTQYFNIRSLEGQLRITRQMTESYEKNLELVEGRYRQGLTSVLDVRQARRNLAQSEAEIPSLNQAIGKARQALAVLQGHYPDAASEGKTEKKGFELPPPIPTGLPSELLNRRPDIRAAEASLEAACARIGVAKANRFPQITLTGSYGYTSNSLQSLFETESELWRIASNIYQPVFDAGKRKAAQKAAEARYSQQLSAYAKTVLDAFAKVEGALLTREQQIKRRSRLMAFSDEAEATLETALDRYQRGLTDYLNVLDAQQAKFQADLNLVKTQYAIYTNRVALYRALGGGWDHLMESRTDTKRKDQNS
ncbi:MAG: efflux transporter outer membrane subunit [Desulfobacterales bacterium]|nr:efflux transporter outer membrane subunit [Desulfobacterales bacterium]